MGGTVYIHKDEGASPSLTSHTHRRKSSRSENVEASGRISGGTPKASSSSSSNPPCSLHLLPLLHTMPNQAATSERVDEQPQQEQQQESFDSTKRFHITFISFKLLVITHINSQHTEPLSLAVLQFYIICEAIYLIALIKVTGPARPNLIYRCLYIVFGTLDSELLLWTSLSLVIWLIVNMCLLVFVLASSGLLTQAFDHFRGIVKLFEDLASSRV